ncbi:MAG: NAD(P)H-dependent glycerol-3-phosphate dehydrogenase [Candidatus Falkowbacteria bacterium]
MKVAILGAGAWGTALAELLADKDYEARLWFYDKKALATAIKERVNPYLPGLRLNKSLVLSGDLAQTLEGADWLVLVMPAQHLRATLKQIKLLLPSRVKLVLCSKGIETKGFALMSDVLAQELPKYTNKAVYLSGPSFADEVAAGRETAVVIAGPKLLAVQAQQLFATPNFRPYVSTDIIGVQVAGAYKNILAIAAGILAGLGKGRNLQAALIARGLKEMTDFGQELGAQRATFSGLAGVGDLVLTTSSAKSRNYSFGVEIGQGARASGLLARQAAVVEGYYTTKAVYGKTRQLGLKLSIAEALYQILYRGSDPEKVIQKLMRQQLKAEL